MRCLFYLVGVDAPVLWRVVRAELDLHGSAFTVARLRGQTGQKGERWGCDGATYHHAVPSVVTAFHAAQVHGVAGAEGCGGALREEPSGVEPTGSRGSGNEAGPGQQEYLHGKHGV